MNMKICMSLRLSDTVISGFNCQQCTLTKLTIKEEKIKKGSLHQEMVCGRHRIQKAGHIS